MEVLVLERMREFVREDHLAHDVPPGDELGRVVPEADIEPARDEHHLLLMRVVEAGDLAAQQLERLVLEADSGWEKSGHRARLAADAQVLVAMVDRDLAAQHLLRLIARLHDQRNLAREVKLAEFREARFHFVRFRLVDGAIVDERVGASAYRDHEECDSPPYTADNRARRSTLRHMDINLPPAPPRRVSPSRRFPGRLSARTIVSVRDGQQAFFRGLS